MITVAFIKTIMPALIRGTLVSLSIAALAGTMGFVIGTLLGFLQSSKNSVFSVLIACYVTLLRGTPMLIQIFFMAYALPALGVSVSLFATAVIAIGINSSAYVSQIIRAGISSVGKGQWEAAKIVGLTRLQAMRFIIFPQAIRIILPALLNEFITLIKDSSLASTIGVVELFKEGSIIISRTYNAIPVYGAIALIYVVLTTTLSLIVGLLERKMNHAQTH